MRVRVYDPDRKGCFCAELYALFGSGIYEQCLVVQDGFLRCFPRVLPRPSDGHYETQVSFLDPELPADWIALPDAVPAFHGYPWVREDPAALRRRTWRRRWEEAQVRWRGFGELGLMPLGALYAAKPLLVGLIPQGLLRRLRGEKTRPGKPSL